MKTRFFLVRLIVIILSIFVMSGCGFIPTVYKLYPGPELPKDQIAIVLVPADIQPVSVDGKHFDNNPRLVSDKIELLPGVHTISVRYESSKGNRYSTNKINLTLEAKPGHTYRIKYTLTRVSAWWRKQEYQWTAWIEDVTTEVP